MGFKKEVREFINDYYNWRKKKDITIATLRDQIQRQQEMINDLHNRLMARDLPELKTFTMPRIEPAEEDYKFEEDEALIGEVVNIPQK